MTDCTTAPRRVHVHSVRILLLGSLVLACATSRATGPSDDALRLSGTYGCMACHGMVRKQVGPGFAQISARYGGDADAPARLAAKIRQGSVGTWGRVIMPRQPKMTVTESETLARWVLAQPPRP